MIPRPGVRQVATGGIAKPRAGRALHLTRQWQQDWSSQTTSNNKCKRSVWCVYYIYFILYYIIYIYIIYIERDSMYIYIVCIYYVYILCIYTMYISMYIVCILVYIYIWKKNRLAPVVTPRVALKALSCSPAETCQASAPGLHPWGPWKMQIL